jgi:hypothetical protein
MKTKSILIIILLLVVLSSCQVPIDNYKGSIVIDKSGKTDFGYQMVIQTDRKYEAVARTIYVYKYDFDRFNLGDTIK